MADLPCASSGLVQDSDSRELNAESLCENIRIAASRNTMASTFFVSDQSCRDHLRNDLVYSVMNRPEQNTSVQRRNIICFLD